MKEPEYIAALNAGETARHRTAEIGETFADALVLLKRAKFAAVAVKHGTETSSEWSYVRVPRAAMRRWLDARMEARPPDALSLHSRLTAFYDDELWLFVGEHRPMLGGRP